MAIQFTESLHPSAFSQVVSQVKSGENFFLVCLKVLRVPSGHSRRSGPRTPTWSCRLGARSSPSSRMLPEWMVFSCRNRLTPVPTVAGTPRSAASAAASASRSFRARYGADCEAGMQGGGVRARLLDHMRQLGARAAARPSRESGA